MEVRSYPKLLPGPAIWNTPKQTRLVFAFIVVLGLGDEVSVGIKTQHNRSFQMPIANALNAFRILASIGA